MKVSSPIPFFPLTGIPNPWRFRLQCGLLPPEPLCQIITRLYAAQRLRFRAGLLTPCSDDPLKRGRGVSSCGAWIRTSLSLQLLGWSKVAFRFCIPFSNSGTFFHCPRCFLPTLRAARTGVPRDSRNDCGWRSTCDWKLELDEIVVLPATERLQASISIWPPEMGFTKVDTVALIGFFRPKRGEFGRSWVGS